MAGLWWWQKESPEAVADAALAIPAPRLYALSQAEIMQEAESGDGAAMYVFGLRFMYGMDGQPNCERGRIWIQRAAEGGHRRAASCLGYIYMKGDGGVEKNLDLAWAWCQRAAEQGDAWGMLWLGYMTIFCEYSKASDIQWLERARACAEVGAKEGDVDAMTALALLRAEWWGGCENTVIATRWCREAALLGDTYAMESLGWAYRDGRGVPSDLSRSRVWLGHAAKRGIGRAIETLAEMYEKGEGGMRDEKRAFELYMWTANLGFRVSIERVGRMLLKGRGVEQDVTAGRAWLSMVCKNE